jgi:hypothetical protein
LRAHLAESGAAGTTGPLAAGGACKATAALAGMDAGHGCRYPGRIDDAWRVIGDGREVDGKRFNEWLASVQAIGLPAATGRWSCQAHPRHPVCPQA